MDNQRQKAYSLVVLHTVLLVLPYVPVNAEGIKADAGAPSQQQPVILNTANNTPQINIQTPNSHGVSRNQYQSFNVNPKGAILNNSTTATSTQLGGWIEANPHLVGRGARIILNEVNSTDPSLLNGHIEVAGQRAQVVIANPSGIQCDGCGFINASRSTLTTGTAEFNGDALVGFHVNNGEIHIFGNGLDDRQTNFTDIIARSVKVNASIWANELSVTTGLNQVTADNTVLASQQRLTDKPDYSIDVAALGGMYAGKIHLIGTEAGVGVKNAGHLGASVGEFTLDSSGKLENFGQIESDAVLSVNVKHVIQAEQAEMEAKQLNLHATTLTNQGVLDGEDVTINTTELNNLQQGRIYGDEIQIQTETLNNHSTTEESAPVIAARSDMGIEANDMFNGQGATIFSQEDMQIASLNPALTSRLVNNGGLIEAGNDMTVAVSELQNLNPDLVTEWQVDSSERIREIQPEGWSRKHDIRYFPLINNHNVEAQPFVNEEGRVVRYFEDYTYYDYTATTRSTHVLSSTPAKILAGHDLTINANVENRDSQIVAGNQLTLSGGELQNSATAGVQEVSFRGIRQFRDWEGNDEELDFYAIVPYNPATITTEFNLGTTLLQDNQSAVGDFNQATIPSSTGSWLQQVSSPEKNYVIEVDPRFADYKTWLGSDYMLQRLSYDPALAQKRLGDGFVEQALIRDQIIQLTGQRYLAGYAEDEQQYLDLMNAGVSVAEQWQLVPGIALSSEQMAALTSDIIWLVSQDMTMADGSVMSTLVPKVYLKPASADMNPEVGLLAGNQVNIELEGNGTNSATILGREQVSIDSKQLHLTGGQVKGKMVTATAENIDINGGVVVAEKALDLHADQDISISSVTAESANNSGKSSFKRENIRRVAGVYVTGADGKLDVSANQDVKMKAAVIQNSGADGEVTIQAGRDLLLGTVNESETNNSIHSDKDFNRMSKTDAVGTRIVSQGNVQINAGNTLEMVGSEVNVAEGNLTVQAKQINIKQAENSYQSDIGSYTKHSGTFSSSSKQQRDKFEQVTASGSLLSAKSLSIDSEKELNITGSQIVADNDVSLTAGEDMNISAAQDVFEESHFVAVKKSGIYSGGGIGFTIGSQKMTTTDDTQRINTVASKVGSLSGDVNIAAGQNYNQTASDVVALQGDVDIRAQRVGIVSASEQTTRKQAMEYSQSGLTIELTSPVIQAATTVKNITDSASETSDPRMKLLAAGTAALKTYNAYNDTMTAVNAAPTGSPVADAGNQAGGINLTLSIGSSKNSSTQTQTSKTANSSQLRAGGDINITATGADTMTGARSDIDVIGSQIRAEGDVNLTADNDINLQAAQNVNTLDGKNKGSSGSIGIGIGTNGGIFITASVSGSKGKTKGNDSTWTETVIQGGNDAGDKVTLTSGKDTNLIGAQVIGHQVTANVGVNPLTGEKSATGGNLNIQSLQDSSEYKDKQKSIGGSVSVGVAGGGGSFSASSNKTDSHYQSVNEQSGIYAGDGGFDVNVAGNANLTGAVIASTDKAIQDNKNSLTTQTLTTSSIQNEAEYEGKAQGATIGTGSQGGVPQLSGAGYGEDSGDADSVTLSAISNGKINITDNNKQQEKSGADAQTTVESLNRDVQSTFTTDSEGNVVAIATDSQGNNLAQHINPIFDAEKVAKEINAQVEITQAFSQQANYTVAAYTKAQMTDLRARYAAETDADKKQALQAEVDQLRLETQVLNILIGAVTGQGGTAVTQEGLAFSAEEMHRITLANSKLFEGLIDDPGNGEKPFELSNASGEAVAGKWDLDPFKTGGTRVDLDKLCGTGNERCMTNPDGSLDLKDGKVQWKRAGAAGKSMEEWLNTEAGTQMRGATGGVQGIKGTFFGRPYEANSWQDKLIEAFGGTHDYVGGQITGLYDEQGNIKRGMSDIERKTYDNLVTTSAIPLSTPFAVARLLPEPVWQAISILLKGAK